MDLSQSANQLYMLGMLNSFKTGNVLFDAIFILLLPTLMGQISQIVYAILYRLKESIKKVSNQDFYVQKIDYSSLIGNNSNYHLYTALCMYINSLKLDIKNAEVESIFNTSESESDYPMPRLPGYKNDSVKQLKLLFKPSVNNWLKASDVIELMFEKNQMPGKNLDGNVRDYSGQSHPYTIYSISIRSRSLNNIQSFIDTSIEYYKNEIENNDNKRYLYLPKYSSEKYEYNSKLTFDAHSLSDSKTFESLFIPDKSNLIEILTNFQNRTGRYGISGVKQQLGLLLHGPSGTGKTSLIKSIAAMFNRNIVTIPLSLLSTNYELFDIMFNLNYDDHDEKKMKEFRSMGIPGISLKKTMNFNELVFVIEDIDAIGNIVHERETKTEIIMNTEENDDDDEDESKKETNNKLDNLSNTLNMLTKHVMPMPMSGMSAFSGPKNKKEKNLDKLNLAGILNAIDGIVDAPGRIIIITSNFPEKLDKALIRPGRIDKILKLDYIAEEQAIEMCNHFFKHQEVVLNENELREIIKNNKFTPAQIEQIALEAVNITEFVQGLKKIGHSI